MNCVESLTETATGRAPSGVRVFINSVPEARSTEEMTPTVLCCQASASAKRAACKALPDMTMAARAVMALPPAVEGR